MSDTVDYAALDEKRRLVVALKKQHTIALRECFDPLKPDSRPTVKQLEILKDFNNFLFQYVQGGNQSGKSATAARVMAWLFQGYHPYFDIKAAWPNEPLTLILMGRLNNQIEELWDKKIKPFLLASEYRENRQGGSLQYVVNPINGNKIIFATHNNPLEAQQKVYSYSAHFVWLDELTDHLGIIEELQRRAQAKRGRMMVTFTPKIRAQEVRDFMQRETPYSKIYRISMLDNPLYKGREDELLSQIMGLPKAQQDTILYGEWYTGESAVFAFDAKKHVENPLGYSVLWPHIVSVDPAASGLMGFTLWAASHEHAQRWYCVAAEKFKGAAPSDLVDTVESKVAHVKHNILYRISDTHENWFIKEASKLKIHYRGVERKRDRKKELIAQFNQALANGRIRLTDASNDLAAELSEAQWSETAEDKIVNASRFHLADTAQYFVDLMPMVKDMSVQTWSHDTRLWHENKKRIAAEATRSAPKKDKWRLVARGGKTTWRR